MLTTSLTTRTLRLIFAGAATVLFAGITGCTACTSQQWAQNAPSIRSETPAARQVQLGAWGENNANRDARD